MKYLGIIILLIVLGVLGFGGYNVWKNGDLDSLLNNKPAQEQTEQEQAQQQSLAESLKTLDEVDHSQQTRSNNVPLAGNPTNIYDLPVQPKVGRRGIGDPNAPVKVQEFFSLTCNHCETFYTQVLPELKRKYIDTGLMYFVYEEFPLNGPALYGSMTARCLPEERYEGFIGLLLKSMEEWAYNSADFKASLKQNAALAGMSSDEFEACFADKELQRQLAENIKNASENYGVSSTPTFVFNDGAWMFSGARSIEQFDLAYEKLTGN